MIIRDADLQSDALVIMDGARDCVRRHKEHLGNLNIGSLFPESDEKLMSALSHLVALPGMEILIAEHEDKVVGGIGTLYSEYLWNPDLLSADQIFWWAAENAPFRTARVLLLEAMKRIDARNAMPIFRVPNTLPKGIEKLYRRLNMIPTETTYMRLP